MSRIYYLSSTNSDLSGGLDFNLNLTTNIGSTPSTVTQTTAVGATDVARSFTQPLHPGLGGDNGYATETVTIDVSTANALIFLSVQAHRINSAGAVQTSSSVTTEQQLSTTGIKTFTIAWLNPGGKGTWTSTDRLRIDFRTRNSGMGNQAVAFNTNDADSRVTTNFTTRTFSIS